MFAKLALVLLLIAAPALAQDAIPDTLALSDEDAQTCKVKACRTITDGAYELISSKVQQLEQENERLRGKVAIKPKYCL